MLWTLESRLDDPCEVGWGIPIIVFLSLCQKVNLSRKNASTVVVVVERYNSHSEIWEPSPHCSLAPQHFSALRMATIACKRCITETRKSLNSHFVVTSSPYLLYSTPDAARSFFSAAAAASQRVLKTDPNLMLNPSVFYVPNLLVSRSLSTDEEESVSAVAALAAAVAKPTTPERSLVPA